MLQKQKGLCVLLSLNCWSILKFCCIDGLFLFACHVFDRETVWSFGFVLFKWATIGYCLKFSRCFLNFIGCSTLLDACFWKHGKGWKGVLWPLGIFFLFFCPFVFCLTYSERYFMCIYITKVVKYVEKCGFFLFIFVCFPYHMIFFFRGYLDLAFLDKFSFFSFVVLNLLVIWRGSILFAKVLWFLVSEVF